MLHCLPKEKLVSCRRSTVRPSLLCFATLIFNFLFLVCSTVNAQQRITGKVTSGDSAIVGASVMVKGSTTATQTDAGGNFSINAPANSTLVISHVNFVSKEVKVSNRTSIAVALQPLDDQLGAVIVVGYGTQRKATLTGSVSQVAGAEVAKSPSPNVTSSLQGRLPGLIVNQRTGTPGRDNVGYHNSWRRYYSSSW